VANPERPFAAILGGAKISGKIDVIENLMDKVDILVIGGGMVFTFSKAMGYEIGDSLLEEDRVDMAREIIAKAKSSGTKLYFPCDAVVAKEISGEAKTSVVEIDKIPPGMKGLDIGPETIKVFSEALADAKTIVWNGPMGVFEHKPFAEGTFAMAKLLAELTGRGATTIVGGGDSASAVSKAGLDEALSHISTGGGASLEYLEGKVLPGLAALTDRPKVGAV
jgi:3-phosphoglycerate kinase